MAPDVAIERFNQGAQYAQEAKYDKAIELWLEIVDALPSAYRPIAHLNIGQAYEAIDNLPAAWFHVAQFADQEGPGGDGAKILMEIESKLRKTHRKVPLSCDLPGARIRFKASSIASYPCANSWWLVPGQHTLTAFLPDDSYPPRNVSFEVNATGPVTGLFIPLRMYEPKSPQSTASPKGKTSTDGAASERASSRASVVKGTSAKSVATGEKTASQTTNQGETGSAPMASDGSGSSGDIYRHVQADETESASVSWAILGSGLAVAAVGGAMHGWAFASNQSAQSDYPDGQVSELVSAAVVDEYNSRYTKEVEPKIMAAYVLYGVGAAAAITGLIMSFFDGPSTDEAGEEGEGEGEGGIAASLSPSFAIQGEGAQIIFDLSF